MWGWDVDDFIGGPHSPLSNKEPMRGTGMVVGHWLVNRAHECVLVCTCEASA